MVFGARRSSPAEQLPAEYGRFSRHERSPTEHRYDDNIIRNLMRAPLPIPNALVRTRYDSGLTLGMGQKRLCGLIWYVFRGVLAILSLA